jgi:hypothetical protein
MTVDTKTIVAKLLEKALTTYDDKTPEAFDALMSKALAALPAKESLVNEPTALGARNGAEEAIKILQKRKPDLMHLGRFGLVAVLSHMAVGRVDEAVDIYLRKQATLADLLAASIANDEEAIAKKAQIEEAKKRALSILKEIGSLTARYALPLLISIIPI